jgi:hypothetical protein
MTARLTVAVLAVCGLCRPYPARAQAGDDAATPTLSALLREVRMLRLAIERQGAIAGRAQLLVGKLALEDQRVARAQAELQRLESETATATANRARTQTLLTERRMQIDRAKDADEAAVIQSDLRRMEAQWKQEGASLSALELRRAEANQAWEAERARYDELSARFDQLERDLAPSRP